PEDARAARIALRVDDHGGVFVEGNRGAVVAAERLARANDHGLDDFALLDRALWRGLLDRADDDVADPRVAAACSALDADAQQLAGAGVVGDSQSGLLLDHRRPWFPIVLSSRGEQAMPRRRARSEP